MRASITSLIVPRRRLQRRTVMFGIVLLLFAVSLGYSAIKGQRVWHAQLEPDAAAVDAQVSNQRRAARRYADVKVPLRGEMCTAYSFDNKEGGFVGERVTECEPAANPPPRSSVGSDSTVDSVSRLHGVAAAFKRQQ